MSGRSYFLTGDPIFEAYQNRGEEPKRGPFYFVAGAVAYSPPFAHRGFAHDCAEDMRAALLKPFAVVKVKPKP